jgi:hypothetical protein
VLEMFLVEVRDTAGELIDEAAFADPAIAVRALELAQQAMDRLQSLVNHLNNAKSAALTLSSN